MSNGSMQFLGRQLAEQAKALGLLVEKMGEMVVAQGNSITKYSLSSNTIQKQFDFDDFIGTVSGGTGMQMCNISFSTYFTGRLKIKVTGRGDLSNANWGFSTNVSLSGTSMGSVGSVIGPDIMTVEREFDVKENDRISISYNYTGNIASVNLLRDIKICYDFANKPDLSV